MTITELPPTSRVPAMPIALPSSGGQTTHASHVMPDAQIFGAGAGSDFANDHYWPDAHLARAVGEPTSPGGQGYRDTQSLFATGGQTSTDSQCPFDTQASAAVRGPILADPLLGMSAEVVDDLERVRIANENRYRTLTGTDEFGFGLTDDHPDIARLRNLVDSLAQAEHQAILNLQRVMRQHALGPWVKSAPGVGEKQAARLLAVVRDPYWNDLHDRPRTVSELWAYCGFHVIRPTGGQAGSEAQCVVAAGSTCHPDSPEAVDTQTRNAVGVAPKRQRGQKSNWNEDARKRAWLIAASCVKQPAGTRYRDVYDQTRAKYADAIHTTDCVRCGPKGKPAPEGSPLSAGHQHARAMRAIAKAVLKDLWLAAKRIHEESEK